MAEISGGIPQALLAAIANMPVPATAAPPGVTDSGGIGTVTGQYALADHTHSNRARRERKTGVNTATMTWVYPVAFDVGSVPVCLAVAEDPTNAASDSYNVQVVGAPTATQCVFRIIRTSVALGILNLNATPGTINLHLVAFQP